MQTKKNSKDVFGARLKFERERLGYTQDEFGAGGGVTRLTQSKYEKGDSSPDMNYLIAIEEMGADFTYLLTGERSSEKSAEEVWNDQANLASAVVEELEKAINAKEAVISPEKKARLVAAIYRNSHFNIPINKRLVSDLLDLAAE